MSGGVIQVAIARLYQLGSAHMFDEIHAASEAGREISDEAAVTIAAWWQSPRDGAAFAALAGGMPVAYDRLAFDVHTAYGEATTVWDRLALDMFSTWALAKLRAELDTVSPASRQHHIDTSSAVKPADARSADDLIDWGAQGADSDDDDVIVRGEN